jgi:hypothetical protein
MSVWLQYLIVGAAVAAAAGFALVRAVGVFSARRRSCCTDAPPAAPRVSIRGATPNGRPFSACADCADCAGCAER